MSLTLYYHPLSSFCHKVLLALYENATSFTAQMVNLMDAEASAEFRGLWPIGKIPVLRDRARDRVVPETSVIIEYLDRHYPGARPLLPADEDVRLEARLLDRVFDLHVQVPMQKIVIDRIRPEGERDPRGVAEARAALATAYGVLEQRLADRPWAAGAAFSLADCAAAPALFYTTAIAPYADAHPRLAAYFERLAARPSVRRVIAEARPYFQYFPFREAMPQRFLTDAS